jgi:hypothetical protein
MEEGADLRATARPGKTITSEPFDALIEYEYEYEYE